MVNYCTQRLNKLLKLLGFITRGPLPYSKSPCHKIIPNALTSTWLFCKLLSDAFGPSSYVKVETQKRCKSPFESLEINGLLWRIALIILEPE